MSDPKVSIIVPVYNLEFYIERCLRSLEKQTFQYLEVIVVNDGGSDDSQLIIDEFVARNPGRFVSYNKTNGGHGSACNYGIERARGDYVMIVDGDDFLDDDTVRFMYEKIVDQNADILIGNLLYIFSDHTEPYIPIPIAGEKLLDSNDKKRLYANWPTPCGRLYRRSMFTGNPDLLFLPGVIFADANFVPKSYHAADRIYYVNRELYNYDITRPTQSLKQTDKRILNIVPVLRDMLEYYKRNGAFDANRSELQLYVTRHCVAWIGKIKTLSDYPKDKALKEVFSIADEYFGKEWLKSGAVYSMVGRIGYWRMKLARVFGYGLIAQTWRFKDFLSRIDRVLERVMNFPHRMYRAVTRRLGIRFAKAFE